MILWLQIQELQLADVDGTKDVLISIGVYVTLCAWTALHAV